MDPAPRALCSRPGLTLRTLLIAALVVGLAAALVSILAALLLVFLGVWENVTQTVSRWAIGALTIAVMQARRRA